MSYFGPSSEPNTVVAPLPMESPDSLPLKGYSKDQLCSYIFRQLGAPTWDVELSKQQILDCIQDALRLYSIWCPNVRVGNIILIRGQFKYLANVDVDQGIVDIQFVEHNPSPTELFYANMIHPAPLFRTGLDEYDTFLRWRKTWMRVTSVRPDWYYDEGEHILYISNPIERYQAAVFFYSSYTDSKGLGPAGAEWVREYALESARYLLGEIWSKFSGAIPGPIANLTLDQAKRQMASTRLTELRAQLRGMMRSAPISLD